jgi:hypothetical protein
VLTVQRLASGSWQSVGSNGGQLPQPGITGLNEPEIGFDGNGSPVVATIAGVGIGVWSAGVALHRFDGSTWLTSPDIGEIPQFTPHAITPSVAALGARLLSVGGVLYQTIIVDTAPAYANPAPTLALLRYVGP